MTRPRHVKAGLWSAVVAALVGTAAAQAQNATLTKGRLQAEPQATVDLAEVGLAGNIATVRLTLAPGIMTDDHTHTGRTSIFVMVQGVLTDVRGTSKREYRAGDVVTVAEGVTHHAENHGTVPVVYVEMNATAKK
jgi:quercetin dioxygenase-like cupin family protein